MKFPTVRLGALTACAIALAGLVACSVSPVASPPGNSSAGSPGMAATAPRLPAGKGRDAFVVFSGGGTPLSNNYSQFLQARALATFFERRYPADSTWVFFGVGNREGEPPRLADARKQLKHGNQLVESWLPGVLPRNRPATRESFLQALRTEILPTVKDGGTLFLFIGDHGTVSSGEKPESVVTMWQLKQSAPGSASWSTDNKEVLSVTELRAVLAEGIGRGRVVFCMTQCHSGGFHYLGVPREVVPSAGWFAGPAPASPPAGPALLAAGFTATDEESLAAGCDPDPDPEKWAGYERFVPECLLGLDLFTLEPSGTGLRSFAAAHDAAIMVDRTIDKPRSSSEQFLERWAQAIEKLAANPAALKPRAAAAVRAFAVTVDTGRIETTDPQLRAKVAEFDRYTASLLEQNTALKELLLAGARRQLDEAIGPMAGRPGSPGGRGGRGAGSDVARKAWRDVVRPAWKAAVMAGEVKELPAAAVAFEKRLLALEDGGRDFMFPTGGGNPMLNEIFWRSGYAFPDKLDSAKAEAVSLWGAERRRQIVAWAKASADQSVREAGGTIDGPGARRTTATVAPGGRGNVSTRPLSRKTAAERVLFYRRTLAAWACLIAMDERSALDQLQALTELERTPLPLPAS